MFRCVYTDVSSLVGEKYEYLYGETSAFRRKKADSYRFEKDRRLCVGAGVLTDTVLRDFGLREKDIGYGVNEYGKPYFIGFPDIRFSISHSGTKVMAVFSDTDVGCDIQQIGNADIGIAKRFFHASEYDAIMSIDDEIRRNEEFFRIWTLKESYIKAVGMGMHIPLNDFGIMRDKDGIRLIRENEDVKYSFREYLFIDGYAASVCCSDGEIGGLIFTEI